MKGESVFLKKSQYVTRCALFCTLGALLPQAFHIFGSQAGKTLLPMHIPAMLAGILLGRGAGLATGIISPILSCLVTAGTMPIAVKVPFMAVEVASYGAACGFFSRLGVVKSLPKAVSCTVSVVFAQIFGRAVNLMCTLFAVYALGVKSPAVQAVGVWTATVSGIPGMLVQIIFIPLIAITLEKLGKNRNDG